MPSVPEAARWSYGATKLLGERLFLSANRQHKLPVHVVRLFNTVGPGQAAEHRLVLQTFVRQAVQGDPLRVYGDGNQVRSFCHVRDTVEALVRLSRTEAAVGQVVNVGRAEGVTMRDTARIVQEMVNPAVPIELVPDHRAADAVQRIPDVSRLWQLTGFIPSIGMNEMIADLVTEARLRG